MFVGIRFDGRCLELLDQRKLPTVEKWRSFQDLESVADAIEQMMVRGAPAIAAAALLALAIDGQNYVEKHPNSILVEFKRHCHHAIERLLKTRPTAVNLFNVMSEMRKFLFSIGDDVPVFEVVSAIKQKAQDYLGQDLERNKRIGRAGSEAIWKHVNSCKENIKEKVSLLTHCNTGSLATGGYGTALGIVRSLFSEDRLRLLYVDETRPWLQGSRLTAFEMQKEGIPFKVIADSAASFAMKRGLVDAIVVGADRIASNGDVANKIGTYQLAISAHFHGIGFFVAASFDTIDLSLNSGEGIIVEERHPDELRCIGGHTISPEGIQVWNPSFDITPHHLVTGIVTEYGIGRPPYADSLRQLSAHQVEFANTRKSR